MPEPIAGPPPRALMLSAVASLLTAPAPAIVTEDTSRAEGGYCTGLRISTGHLAAIKAATDPRLRRRPPRLQSRP